MIDVTWKHVNITQKLSQTVQTTVFDEAEMTMILDKHPFYPI